MSKVTKVAILATGSEIIHGEILNTTTYEISKKLSTHGFSVVTHVAVADREAAILAALQFLQKDHDEIIVTGGLGPTSDDLTRNAVSKFVNRPLAFSEEAWASVQSRLAGFQIAVHCGDKRQAYFPEGALLYRNMLGTAWGCSIQILNCRVFMLPGPPQECLSMVDKFLIPLFRDNVHAVTPLRTLRWRLLGITEGELASEIELALEGTEWEVGYRWHYPYVDLKVTLPENQVEDAESKICPVVSPFVVSRLDQTATQLLQVMCAEESIAIEIEEDLATRGAFATKVRSPVFPRKKIGLSIFGLEKYWEKRPYLGRTKIEVQGHFNSQSFTHKISIPYRGPEVLEFAVEFVSHSVLKELKRVI